MTLLKRPTLEDIYAPIQADLGRFSENLKKELASNDELIHAIHAHLLKMTGKFLRPVLALLTSHIENKPDPKTIDLAVAIELIHTATLVHDDIIDNSELRRNQPSIYSKWGREISIVSGDYLYAKAFLLLANLQDSRIQQAFAACAHIMCEGEMKQIEKRNNFLMPETEYLKIIHQKTAALFQAACMGGAYFSGTNRTNTEKLGQYGFSLGMAFQIVDDCLDLTGKTENLGKTAGLDIVKNDVTLPLLYLFRELRADEREALLESVRKDGHAVFESVRELAVERKAVERAMGKASEYVENALKSLEGVRESAFKESLTRLAHYCLERIR